MVTDGRPARYALQAEDGRLVTNDQRTGPALTSNLSLAYTWSSATEAADQCGVYEAFLRVRLQIVVPPPIRWR